MTKHLFSLSEDTYVMLMYFDEINYGISKTFIQK